MSDEDCPRCPHCGHEPSEVSWQTGPGQEVCGNDACPVNTWDERLREGP